MYKTGGVAFDINANRTNGRTTSIQFMTQDTGARILRHELDARGSPVCPVRINIKCDAPRFVHSFSSLVLRRNDHLSYSVSFFRIIRGLDSHNSSIASAFCFSRDAANC